MPPDGCPACATVRGNTGQFTVAFGIGDGLAKQREHASTRPRADARGLFFA